jgi:hypothetical protein
VIRSAVLLQVTHVHLHATPVLDLTHRAAFLLHTSLKLSMPTARVRWLTWPSGGIIPGFQQHAPTATASCVWDPPLTTLQSQLALEQCDSAGKQRLHSGHAGGLYQQQSPAVWCLQASLFDLCKLITPASWSSRAENFAELRNCPGGLNPGRHLSLLCKS